MTCPLTRARDSRREAPPRRRLLRAARAAFLIALSLVVGLPIGCSGGGDEPTGDGLSGKLTLTGSSTVAPLVSDIARRFESEHPGVRVDVQTGGSSRGITDALSGLADIGMSSRGLTEDELAEGRETHAVAHDGVCFIVHASNPVESLTDEQLRSIFTGEITRWEEVGGTPGEITVYNRAEGRSELKLMGKYLGIEAADFAPDVISGENQQGIKQVASDPSSICYMSVGASEFAANNGTTLKLLPLRGVAAGAQTVASGEFPCGRPLLLVTQAGELSPLASAFIEYARSSAVQDLVRDHAFVAAAPL